jgi:hypothetical protein
MRINKVVVKWLWGLVFTVFLLICFSTEQTFMYSYSTTQNIVSYSSSYSWINLKLVKVSLICVSRIALSVIKFTDALVVTEILWSKT